MTDLPTIVLFRRPTGFGNVPESKDLPSQSQCSAEYYRARERAERAAASRARSPAAICAHQDLAERYALLSRQAGAAGED